MACKKETKALVKKNAVDKGPLAEALVVASTTTVLPSDAEKAASTTTAAATTKKTAPTEDKVVKPASTDPPVPPPASNDCPTIGVKSPKAQYLPSSAKALAEAAAEISSTGQWIRGRRGI
jgi:hypothetical protein